MVFQVGEDLVFLLCDWFLSEHILQAKGGLFWFGNLRASYSIATPAKVSSGSRPRPGMGEGAQLHLVGLGVAVAAIAQRGPGRP